jgi:MSHA biogenesis protein MshP
MRSQQRGVSLIAALFLIVVLALLALFAVRIGGSAERDVSTGLMQARALAAARSGIEYGSYRALVANTCNAVPPAVSFNTNVALTEGALNGFTVNVTCRRVDHSSRYRTYDLAAVAWRGTYGSADYVARSVSKSVAGGNP